MGITKEWLCPGHGPFESDKPVCPRGCNVAEREFRTAPSISSGSVGRTDALLRAQADAHGVSNFRRAHEGQASRTYNPSADKMAAFNEQVRKKYPMNWGAVPKEGGAQAALAAYNAPATNALEQTKPLLTPPPVQKIRDPQNLQVDVSKAA